jgi:hypothetical protein
MKSQSERLKEISWGWGQVKKGILLLNNLYCTLNNPNILSIYLLTKENQSH